tara:strand:- start:145 stop:336 length:192 start_codon:yes stop_codon:yes gene_type:complete
LIASFQSIYTDMGEKNKDNGDRFQKALDEVYDLLNPNGDRFKAFLARRRADTKKTSQAEEEEE